jgi:hypothetical protein
VYRLLFAIAAEQVTARATAGHGAGPLFAHTDDEGYFWAAHGPRYRNPFDDRLKSQQSRCWQADIGALLPVPASGTPISEVLAFRHRYDDERRRLIRAVGELQHQLRQWNEDPREIISALREELADAVADLQAAGTAAKMTWVWRGVYVFIAFATAATIGLSEAARLDPAALATTTAALTVGGGIAVNLATNQIGELNPKSRPFTYLHRAQKEFPLT